MFCPICQSTNVKNHGTGKCSGKLAVYHIDFGGPQDEEAGSEVWDIETENEFVEKHVCENDHVFYFPAEDKGPNYP